MKIDTKIEFHFDVKVGPDSRRPTAPWYAYFPVDPRMLPSPQATPYPPWPAQFPPRATPSTVPPQPQRQALDMNAARTASLLWYNQGAPGTNVQPVSYSPVEVPSYWYHNR